MAEPWRFKDGSVVTAAVHGANFVAQATARGYGPHDRLLGVDPLTVVGVAQMFLDMDRAYSAEEGSAVAVEFLNRLRGPVDGPGGARERAGAARRPRMQHCDPTLDDDTRAAWEFHDALSWATGELPSCCRGNDGTCRVLGDRFPHEAAWLERIPGTDETLLGYVQRKMLIAMAEECEKDYIENGPFPGPYTEGDK